VAGIFKGEIVSVTQIIIPLAVACVFLAACLLPLMLPACFKNRPPGPESRADRLADPALMPGELPARGYLPHGYVDYHDTRPMPAATRHDDGLAAAWAAVERVGREVDAMCAAAEQQVSFR
jgi:hypothetical protein